MSKSIITGAANSTTAVYYFCVIILSVSTLLLAVEYKAAEAAGALSHYLVVRLGVMLTSALVLLYTRKSRPWITADRASSYVVTFMAAYTVGFLCIMPDYWLGWLQAMLIFPVYVSSQAAEYKIFIGTFIIMLFIYVFSHIGLPQWAAAQKQVPLMYSTLAVTAVIVHFVTIVIRKRGEASEAMQSQLLMHYKLASLGKLASGLAHEINNPLTIINMAVEGIEGDPGLSDGSKAELDAINKCITRIFGIIKSFRSYVRNDSGAAKTVELNVVQVVGETATLLGPMLARDKIELEVVWPYDRSRPAVAGLPGKLEQIITNLVVNAADELRQLGGPGPKITVSVIEKKELGVVSISVEDNGPGVPPGIQKSIFDPFFTTKQQGKGTGLGLHICATIAQELKGHIFYDSQFKNGARFTLELPVVQTVPREG
jgi:signal transduction histidine kinase